jgi:hypothetical protein
MTIKDIYIRKVDYIKNLLLTSFCIYASQEELQVVSFVFYNFCGIDQISLCVSVQTIKSIRATVRRGQHTMLLDRMYWFRCSIAVKKYRYHI